MTAAGTNGPPTASTPSPAATPGPRRNNPNDPRARPQRCRHRPPAGRAGLPDVTPSQKRVPCCVRIDMRRWHSVAPMTLLTLALGCSPSNRLQSEPPTLCQVTGKVTFRDGKPFTAGKVVFHYLGEDEKYILEAAIEPDGAYRIKYGQAEGVPPGRYRVLVVPTPPADPRKPPPDWPPLSGTFSRFETSRLEYTVKDRTNSYNITVWK